MHFPRHFRGQQAEVAKGPFYEPFTQILPAATGPPSRRRRTQMLKPLGWPRRPAPPRAPLQRPDPSLTAPESEARALRGHPTDSDSDPRA